MSCVKLIDWPGIQAKIYLYNGKDKDNVVELDKFKQGNFNRKTIDEIKKKVHLLLYHLIIMEPKK
jgi:hypothetical protein